ncbi:hypothetical protein ACHAW5_004341 [Stephanodiscus triporus]|uniref:Major facilitator superfamily (MFS) profile domain-containing protein n=1 Tax=Stephanodiscus triporus TaxID=2934178 RepID=A0ABD3QZK8_9STRA
MPRMRSATTLLLLALSASSSSALRVDRSRRHRAALGRTTSTTTTTRTTGDDLDLVPPPPHGGKTTRRPPPDDDDEHDDDDDAVVVVGDASTIGPTRLPSHRDVRRGGGVDDRDVVNDGDGARGGGGASPALLRSMRLLYLTYYAGQGALMPYLPVYFHSLGHSGSAVGTIGAVRPLTTFLLAPMWGALSSGPERRVHSLLHFAFVSGLMLQTLVGAFPSLRYLLVTTFASAALNAPVKSLIDSVVMSRLTDEKDRHQFGRMRLWGQIGFGIGSSVVGRLLGASSSPPASEAGRRASSSSSSSSAAAAARRLLGGTMRSPRGYEWAFVAHAVLSMPVLFCLRAFRPGGGEKETATIESRKDDDDDNGRGAAAGGTKDGRRRTTTDVAEGLRLLSRNADALVFFFLVFVIGTSSGCIENFAYVRVGEVGGTGTDMGVLRLVSSLAGAPMFWFSGPITDALGTDVVLVLSLLAYAVRFFNYAWMTRPYHALPAEALRGLTFALFWSAGSAYAHGIGPTGTKATMLLIMNAMYGGLGQSMGAVLGGKLQSKLGTVDAFVVSGIFDACFVFALVAYLASGKKRAFSTTTLYP